MDVWAYDGPHGQAYRAEYFDLRGGQVFEEVGMTATPANYQTYTDVYFYNLQGIRTRMNSGQGCVRGHKPI